MIKHLIEKAVSIFCMLVYEPQYRKFKGRQKVLFCVAGDLMFRFSNDAWREFTRISDYEVFVCSPVSLTSKWSCFRQFSILKSLAKANRYHYVAGIFAKMKKWDLIICAEPSKVLEEFDKSIPIVLTNHAIVTNKRYNGYLYPYHPEGLTRKDGGCFVSSIFEASGVTKQAVGEQTPSLLPFIDVVGSLQADQLVSANRNRVKIREQLGFSQSDFVILVQSTFRESLIEDLGYTLLDECKRLAELKGYKFIISLHPHLWHGLYAASHPWGERALAYASDSIRIRRPEEDGDSCMIASDIALTDHTSLCISYALLDKPMLFYLPKNGFQATDVLEPLLELYPQLTEIGQLDNLIQEAQRVHDPARLHAVMDRFVSYRGQAAERINQVFDRLLK